MQTLVLAFCAVADPTGLAWSPRPWWAIVGCLMVSCGGTTVSRMYESDVRFERCLALAWEAEARWPKRRRCWSEWLEHYSSGQPRDKVDHARKELAEESPGLAPSAERPTSADAPTPEPTSAFVPVPMMATSATVSPVAGAPASALPKPDKPPPAASPCERRCDQALAACLSGCKVPSCEQACTQRHTRCVGRCEWERAGEGSRSPQ
jgi:hypothetical protein